MQLRVRNFPTCTGNCRVLGPLLNAKRPGKPSPFYSYNQGIACESETIRSIRNSIWCGIDCRQFRSEVLEGTVPYSRPARCIFKVSCSYFRPSFLLVDTTASGLQPLHRAMNHFSSGGGDGGQEEDFEGVLRGSGRQQRGLQLEQVGLIHTWGLLCWHK